MRNSIDSTQMDPKRKDLDADAWWGALIPGPTDEPEIRPETLPATRRQLELLRELGYGGSDNITSEEARTIHSRLRAPTRSGR